MPLDLAANIDRGDAIQRFYCVGCHAERTQWRYPELSTRIAGDPMYFQIPEELTFQQVADLVAYLNRFRLKVP